MAKPKRPPDKITCSKMIALIAAKPEKVALEEIFKHMATQRTFVKLVATLLGLEKISAADAIVAHCKVTHGFDPTPSLRSSYRTRPIIGDEREYTIQLDDHGRAFCRTPLDTFNVVDEQARVRILFEEGQIVIKLAG